MNRLRTSTLIVSASLLVFGLVSAADRAGITSGLRTQASASGPQSPFPQARARVCSPGTMRGTHGYSYQGAVMGSAIAAVGPITFDGEGNLAATYSVSLGGQTFQGAFTGTYTVNADCTGTVTLLLPMLGLTSNGSFVIVDNGKETFFTGTDSGVTVSGATKRL
jgi:hypothetical protein